MPTRAEVAAIVDHTLLKTDATPAQIAAVVAEGRDLGVFSVCVSPNMLPDPSTLGTLKLATVAGFPSGKHITQIKAAEAAAAVAAGADEVDMVIDIGQLKDGRVDDVRADIAAVKQAIPAPGILKVIIESAALTDAEIVAASQACVDAGADFVKTATGFLPAGGATVAAVELMAKTVNGAIGVKAAGGIRTWDDAVAMINAGATRLGLSATRQILDSSPA